MPTAKLERRACGRVEEAPNLSRISSQVALPHLPSLRAPREARSRRERHRSSGLASPLSFFTLPTVYSLRLLFECRVVPVQSARLFTYRCSY